MKRVIRSKIIGQNYKNERYFNVFFYNSLLYPRFHV